MALFGELEAERDFYKAAASAPVVSADEIATLRAARKRASRLAQQFREERDEAREELRLTLEAAGDEP